MLPFKEFAKEEFVSFNGRQQQFLATKIIGEEVDLGTLYHSGVIIDHMFLHDYEKRKLIKKNL